MSEILNYISTDSALMYLVMGMAIAYALTWIATVTPNSTDNKIMKPVLSILNFVAGNVGNAKSNPELLAQRDELKLKLTEVQKKLK